MNTENGNSGTPLYRRPWVAVITGAALAAGMMLLLLEYVMPAYGQAGILVMLILAPMMPGFVVGLMTGSEGDKWAAISAGAFVIGAAVCMPPDYSYGDRLITIMISLGLGSIAVVFSALFGKLGEMTFSLAPKLRYAVAALSILLISGFPMGYWLDVQWEMLQFRRSVLPDIRQRISDHVVKLPSDTRWEIQSTSFRMNGRHSVVARTEVQGHKLWVGTTSSGDAIDYCRCGYEPSRPVRIAGQAAARNYLRSLGASEEVIRRLRYISNRGVMARSWFCRNALLAHPAVKPCTDQPSCGSDLSFALLSDGTIRIGFYYYRASGSPSLRTMPSSRRLTVPNGEH